MSELSLVVVEQSSLSLILGYSDSSALQLMDKAELREVIAKIETTMATLDGQIEIPIVHHFSKGIYAREMQMPAGSLLVGKIHKHENLSILSAGEVSVLSQDGIMRIKAPYTFVATAGAKRVIYAHTDTVWTSIHGTDEKDVEKIEEEFIAKDYEEIIFQEAKWLG